MKCKKCGNTERTERKLLLSTYYIWCPYCDGGEEDIDWMPVTGGGLGSGGFSFDPFSSTPSLSWGGWYEVVPDLQANNGSVVGWTRWGDTVAGWLDLKIYSEMNQDLLLMAVKGAGYYTGPVHAPLVRLVSDLYYNVPTYVTRTSIKPSNFSDGLWSELQNYLKP